MRAMTRRILFASLRRRTGRVAVAVCAVALGGSLVVAALNLRHGIRQKLAGELRSYGANLVLVPRSGPFLNERGLAALEDEGLKQRVLGYAPFAYSVVRVGGNDVVLAGTRFSQATKISPWWQVEGRWPERGDEALVGVNAAAKLGLGLGGRFSAVHKSSELGLTVVGLLRTGGGEEHQLFVPLESVQSLTHLRASLNSVLVSVAAGENLDRTVDVLQKAWPEVEAKALLSVSRAEAVFLARLEIFLALVSLLILLAAGLGVYAAMSTAALERKVEMALMRALGAEKNRVARIFASEALAIGVIGGLAGSAVGLVLSEMMGLSVFGSWIVPGAGSLLAGPAVGAGISLACSLWVVKRALALQPAAVLKGE